VDRDGVTSNPIEPKRELNTFDVVLADDCSAQLSANGLRLANSTSRYCSRFSVSHHFIRAGLLVTEEAVESAVDTC
jgi:hypothetical protein